MLRNYENPNEKRSYKEYYIPRDKYYDVYEYKPSIF